MRKITRRGIALGMLAGLVAVPASIPALAQDGAPADVTHLQSVVTQLSETGETGTSRVFTQLSVTGDGPVEVVLADQSTRGLRNLDGFGRPSTDGDSVIYGIDAKPDGVHKRTVANHTADLPVEIDVAYSFDGSTVENPKDIVGRTGELAVTYTVRNTTVQPTEVDVRGGRGDITTETVDVGVPFVGSLSLPLDGRFTNIRANGANIAGDGQGNSLLEYELVLFEPLGSFEKTVSWSAHVTDAIVPEANAQVVPVSSDTYQVLPDAMSQYADVNAAMEQLSGNGGAGRIGMVVTALASGSSELLDGMNQLADGTEALAEGLGTAASGSGDLAEGTGQAAAGSRDLADGTGQAAAGSRELASGLGELRDGAGQVAGGTGQVAAGAGQLSSGLGEIADGAGQVAGGTSAVRQGAGQLAAGLINEAAPGAQLLAAGLAGDALGGSKAIRDGLRSLVAAMGETGDDDTDGTVIGGINALLAGLKGDLATGTGALKSMTAGLEGSFGPDPDAGGAHAGQKAAAAAAGAGEIKAGAGDIKAGIGAITASAIPGGDHLAYGDVKDDLICIDPSDPVVGAGGIPKNCFTDAVVVAISGGALPSMAAYNAATGNSVTSSGLVPLNGLLGSFTAGLTGIEGGAGQIQAGLQAQSDSLGDWPASCEAAITHVMTADATGGTPDGLAVIKAQSCIATSVDDGLNHLVIPGMTKLLAGINNPSCDFTDPTSEANPCGVKQVLQILAAGSGELTDGLGDAADGAGALAAGIQAAADGSGDLAAGVRQLDNGAKALAAGAGQAASGSRDLAAGAGELDAGAKQLAAGSVAAATGGRDLSDGLGQIDDGANQLSDGLGQIDDGANQLADGLGDAQDGSEQIADGTGSARDGVVGIEDALGELDEFDMPRLMTGLDRAGLDSDGLLKQARAADDRAKAGDGLPYGTAEGANASAVYQFEIAGVGTEQGVSTPVRAGAALLAFGAVGALGMGVRRRLI